jgi:hypothetical protein
VTISISLIWTGATSAGAEEDVTAVVLATAEVVAVVLVLVVAVDVVDGAGDAVEPQAASAITASPVDAMPRILFMTFLSFN